MSWHHSVIRVQRIFAAGILAIVPFAVIELHRVHANPPQAASGRTFSVVSLNLAKETSADTIVRSIEDAPRLRKADLFLLQEVWGVQGQQSVAEEAARKLGYSAAFGPAPGFSDQGLAIVSRYPITDVRLTSLRAYDLRFHSRNRLAISATAKTPWGDVRVWNVHLDTRINAGDRLEQLQPVIDDAARHTGPRLIGGDFNTNELYWLGNVVPLPFGPAHRSTIRDSMIRHGFKTPFPDELDTFPLFGSHLDWIFMNELTPVDASVEPAPFSDHHAIWVGARL